MELKDIILAILIIVVPIYIFMSNNNKNKDFSGSTQTIIEQIVAIFTGGKKPKDTIPNYRINDSGISSVNYKTIDNNPIININSINRMKEKPWCWSRLCSTSKITLNTIKNNINISIGS